MAEALDIHRDCNYPVIYNPAAGASSDPHRGGVVRPERSQDRTKGNVMAKTVERLQTSEIAARIFDGSTIALTGSGIFLEADDLFAAIEHSFLTTGSPRDLTIVHALGVGDGAES